MTQENARDRQRAQEEIDRLSMMLTWLIVHINHRGYVSLRSSFDTAFGTKGMDVNETVRQGGK